MSILEILQKIGYTDVKDNGKYYRTKPLYRSSNNNTSLCIEKNTGCFYDFK